MELTALIMDKRSKKVKQFSLPADVEYVASEFDDCWLYPDVATDRDLGEYVVEELGVELSKETLQNYFDYEKYGRDVRLSEGGSFVDKGYFVSR